MAKTMRNIVITCVVLIVIAVGASALLLTGGCGKMASDPLGQTRADAVNAVIDSSGIKQRIDSELRSHATDLATQVGISPSLAEGVVDSIAVEDWKAVPLPDSAKATDNFTVEADGTPVEITTYDDTSIVTVEAYGQEVTFEVPESARAYVPYVTYLQYVNLG